MKIPLFCLLLTVVSLSTSAQALYPFIHGDRWGFIDQSGRERIPAEYRSVGQFSEGLAAVRLGGTYGYINETGQLTIPFRFDYAEPFSGGVAIAYLKGKPYLIDKSGARLFNHNFSSIVAAGQPRVWIVQSQARRFGLINQSGNLLLDTIYSAIDQFRYGKAVIHKQHGRRGDNNFKEEAAIVNAKGNILLPFGRFTELSAISDGYFIGRYDRDTGDYQKKTVLIAPGGKPVFTVSSEEWYVPMETFRAGLSPVSISVKHPEGSAYSPGSFSGALDATGVLLFSDSSWDRMTAFSMNRAFVKPETVHNSFTDKWIMIDSRGHRVGNGVFMNVYGAESSSPVRQDIFQNAIAFVQSPDGKWGAIDTNGNYVIRPLDLDSMNGSRSIEVVSRIGDVLIISEDISTMKGGYPYLYGFWDPRRQVLVRAQYYDLSIDSTPDALIRVVTPDKKLAYLNRSGGLVWKENGARPTEPAMDIDYMNRGYFYASGLQREDLAGYGGWAGSDNAAKSFKNDVPFKHNDLSIFISNTSKPWKATCKGQKVYVVNDSHDTLYFPAQDSRLYMNVQAMDVDGSWKDIEYLPSSWCGNSYHTLALSPKQYWDFVMPVYEGELKTKLRIKLTYRYTSKLYEGNDNEVLYSNVVDGNINPAQFWRRREYYPAGLMDPYDD